MYLLLFFFFHINRLTCKYKRWFAKVWLQPTYINPPRSYASLIAVLQHTRVEPYILSHLFYSLFRIKANLQGRLQKCNMYTGWFTPGVPSVHNYFVFRPCILFRSNSDFRRIFWVWLYYKDDIIIECLDFLCIDVCRNVTFAQSDSPSNPNAHPHFVVFRLSNEHNISFKLWFF